MNEALKKMRSVRNVLAHAQAIKETLLRRVYNWHQRIMSKRRKIKKETKYKDLIIKLYKIDGHIIRTMLIK